MKLYPEEEPNAMILQQYLIKPTVSSLQHKQTTLSSELQTNRQPSTKLNLTQLSLLKLKLGN